MNALLLAVALTVTDIDAACKAQCECMTAPDDGGARTCTLLAGCDCARLLGLDGGVRAVPMPFDTVVPPIQWVTAPNCDHDAVLAALRGLAPFFRESNTPMTDDLIPWSPSRMLREQADRLDARDAAIRKAEIALAACEEKP